MPSQMRTVRVDLKLLGLVKLSCPQCDKLSDFDPSRMQDRPRGQHITCDCGYTFSALIEGRGCTRRTVNLLGAYLLRDSFGQQESGPVIIEDLSYSGVLCRTIASHTLTPGDHVRVKIVLDDEAKTELIRSLEVTRVQDGLVAGKFIEIESAFDTILADYLITR